MKISVKKRSMMKRPIMNRSIMTRTMLLLASVLLFQFALAADPDQSADSIEQADQSDQGAQSSQLTAAGQTVDQPKTMSGMSILGNEEAPKALVIVPWKSSELGDGLSLSDSLDDRAKPVDRKVFLRELSYYEIRSGD